MPPTPTSDESVTYYLPDPDNAIRRRALVSGRQRLTWAEATAWLGIWEDRYRAAVQAIDDNDTNDEAVHRFRVERANAHAEHVAAFRQLQESLAET